MMKAPSGMNTLALLQLESEDELDAQSLAGARILVIMPSIPVQGMERANLQIMRMMRRRGADVLFVTEGNFGERLRREVELINCHWVNASFIKSFEERLHLTMNIREMTLVLMAWARAARQVRRIIKDYEPTHIHVTNVAFFLYSLPALWRARQTVVFRLPNPPAQNLPKLKQRLSDWIWRFLVVPNCDVIVCNSQYTLSVLRGIVGRDLGARLINNCPPRRALSSESDCPQVNEGRFNIIYTGRITPEKGIGELFEAALRVVRERERVDFYLAGQNNWKNPFAEKLMREVERLNLQTRINFTGEIDDVHGLLRQCQLHVCPSVSSGESFPNVVLEAKTEHLPSVVFPTAGLPEAVTHLVDGYVCQHKTAQSLYEGLMYFIDNPRARESASRAAADSLEHFSEDAIAGKWRDLFSSTAA
jgi:glycosyltransferase involved in cell wall biosynthesis